MDRDTSRLWVEVAQSSRVLRDLLTGTPSAAEGSHFDLVQGGVDFESVEQWCRSYLSAALEHLGMWADLVAPLKLHPDAELHHTPRPAQTLARAALESASQAVWILAADNPREMMRRHVALVLADWEEQRKASIDPAVRAALKAKGQAIREVFAPWKVDLTAPTYLSLVTRAAGEVRDTIASSELGDAAQVERLWRASAGSAHGKRWPSLELTVKVEIDGRSYSFADPSAMTAMLTLAEKVTQFGVVCFVERAGHTGTLPDRVRRVFVEWYSRVPKREGAPTSLPEA